MIRNISPSVLFSVLSGAVCAVEETRFNLHTYSAMALNLVKCYETALRLTKEAGKLIADGIQKSKNVSSKSSSEDMVTETDKAVEEILIAGLKAEFPDHRFIAEESGDITPAEANTKLPTWVIDPVDGTMNFVHGYPQVCVSVGLWCDNDYQLGFVYNPVLDQMFSARRGHGAFLNGSRMHVTDRTALRDSLVGADIMAYFTSPPAKLENAVANVRIVKSKCQGIRIPGSVAVALAYVAWGVLDAVYFEAGPYSWDFAAGVALVREAGGVISAVDGGPFDLFGRNILAAATPDLAKELSSILIPFHLPRQGDPQPPPYYPVSNK